MKNIIILAVYLTASLFSIILAQNFYINERNINFNANSIFRPVSKVEMIASLKYKNDYYSIFEEKQMYDFGHKENYLVKYDNSGKILFAEKLPQKSIVLHRFFCA